MYYRIQEIASIMRQTCYAKPPAIAMRDRLMPDVDLDEEQLELFAQYVTALEGIGVNLQDERLQDTLNAYPDNMEAAIQTVLEYAQILRQKHQDFLDQYHATNCLTKALREGWQPHSS